MNCNLPRGYRNNNPLNIRHGNSKWQGMAQQQTDPAFVQFVSMAYGYRAAFKLLRNYYLTYNLRTIADLIGRWAPQNENNTAAYIKKVSEMTGIAPNHLIAYQDANAWIAIVRAMAYVENGAMPRMEEICEGWRKTLSPASPVKGEERYRIANGV